MNYIEVKTGDPVDVATMLAHYTKILQWVDAKHRDDELGSHLVGEMLSELDHLHLDPADEEDQKLVELRWALAGRSKVG